MGQHPAIFRFQPHQLLQGYTKFGNGLGLVSVQSGFQVVHVLLEVGIGFRSEFQCLADGSQRFFRFSKTVPEVRNMRPDFCMAVLETSGLDQIFQGFFIFTDSDPDQSCQVMGFKVFRIKFE